MDGIQPVLNLLQLVGGIGELIQPVAKLFRHVLNLIHEIGSRIMQLRKRIVISRNTCEGSLRLRKKSGRTLRILIAVQTDGRVLQPFGEFFRVLKQLTARFERLVLPCFQIRTGNLLNLIPERLHPAQLLTLVHTQALNLALQRDDVPVFFPIVLQKRLVAGKTVQETEMIIFVKK